MRDLVPSVSQPLGIIQHTSEFDRPFSIGIAMPGTEDQIREAVNVHEDAAELEEMKPRCWLKRRVEELNVRAERDELMVEEAVQLAARKKVEAAERVKANES